MSSTSTSFPESSRSQWPWSVPPRLIVPPARDSSTTPPIQLTSELDEMRAHYPPDRRNPMDLDFICHNSMKYRCCFCEERILVHESELVLDRFFEKHRCPKRRGRSAESSTPPASPTSDDLPTSHDQASRTGHPTSCTYTRPITLSGNSSSLRAGHEATGMHATSYVWNVKIPQYPGVDMSVRWIILDDTNPQIRYDGEWTATNGANYDAVGNFGPTYNNTLHGASSAAGLSFSYKGTRARLFGTTDIKNSSNVIDPTWDCLVDGKSVGPTKLFPYPQNNWVLCEWTTPSDGDHTVSAKVTSNGQAFWVDRIAYVPGEDVELEAATISVGRLDPAISFDAGQWKPLGDIGTMTQVTGAAVRFKFQGSRVTWQGTIPVELPHNSTTATYSIDGQAEVRFTLPGISSSQKASQFNYVFFKTEPFSVGEHELVVKYEGDSSTTPLVLGSLVVENVSNFRSTPKGPMVGAIVGSVMGGLALMIAAIFAFLFFRKRMQAKREASYKPVLVEEPFHYIKPFTLTRPTDATHYDQLSVTSYQPTTYYRTPLTHPSSNTNQITPYPFTAPTATSGSMNGTPQNYITPVIRPPPPPPPVPQPMSRSERKRAEAEAGAQAQRAAAAGGAGPQPRLNMTSPTATATDLRSQSSHSSIHSHSHSGSRSHIIVHEDSGVRLPNTMPEELDTPIVEHPPHYTPG